MASNLQRNYRKADGEMVNGKLVQMTSAQFKADMLALMNKQNCNKMLTKLTVASAEQLKTFVDAVEPDMMMMSNLANGPFPRTVYAFITLRSAHPTLFPKVVETAGLQIDDVVSQFSELCREKMKPNTPGFLYVRMLSPASQTAALMEAMAAQFGTQVMMTPRPSPPSSDGDKTVEWFLCVTTAHSQTLIKTKA